MQARPLTPRQFRRPQARAVQGAATAGDFRVFFSWQSPGPSPHASGSARPEILPLACWAPLGEFPYATNTRDALAAKKPDRRTGPARWSDREPLAVARSGSITRSGYQCMKLLD